MMSGIPKEGLPSGNGVRGLKRPRSSHAVQCPNYGLGTSVQLCHCDTDPVGPNDDDVDVPLSKRINRLNIEQQTAHVGSSAVIDNTNGGPDKEGEEFRENYPYDPNSQYYNSNQLLYSLYLQRSQRRHSEPATLVAASTSASSSSAMKM